MKLNQRKKNFFTFLTLCAAALAVTTSCESEYTTLYNDVPGDTLYVSGDAFIKSFTVQEHDDQEPIKAAIVNDTIKVLWMSYHEMPETITPKIILADKASIIPGPGTPMPFKTGEKYTVTSEAGTSKQYTLQVDFRQPQPRFFGGMDKGDLGGWKSIRIGQYNGLDNIWFNLAQTRVYLVSAADQTTEYDCEIIYFDTGTGVNPFRDAGIYFYLPTDMPEGKYDLRIKNGEYILRSSNEEYFFNTEITESTKLQISLYTNTFSLAAGDTFSFRGTKLNTGDAVAISVGTNGTRYPLEIVSRTAYEATFKIPVGTPPANYTRMFFTDATTEERISLSSFTVTQ